MTAARHARVGDIIEHDQEIPANVVELRDEDGDPWRRSSVDPGIWTCRDRHNGMPYGELTEVGPECVMEYAPLRVVEVDPEPQPVEISQHCNGCGNWMPPPAVHKATCPEEHARQTALGLRDIAEQPAAPTGPQVFEVPQPPPGVTRVVLRCDTVEQFAERERAGSWDTWLIDGQRWSWSELFGQADGGRLTDATPPREPRTWSHIGDGSVEGDHLPAVVSVRRESGTSVWTLEASGRYRREGEHDVPALSLLELRTLGKVTEVLDA